MTDPTQPLWVAWAPPLDPPTQGGMPFTVAQGIADEYWSCEPHLAAALMWEWYAATLQPTAAVSSVNTGAQTVSYNPPAPSGEFGLAMQRVQWHRSFLGGLLSVPLVNETSEGNWGPLADMSWWIDP